VANLFTELKRRNVFRVGAAYAIVAWLLVEVASVVLPTFEAPDWVMKVFTFLLILGFPVALIFAWAFELTPEGIKREAAVAPDESITHVTGRKLDFAIIGLLLVAVIFLVFDNYVLESRSEPVPLPVELKATPVEPVLADGPAAREKSIAVLPFLNMSGDPEQEFFSDGISEEVLNVLAKVKGLRVTSRTSAFAFKGTNASIREIAAELGVEHALEGSVRMAGDRVRITTQLIEVETDSHLWSESYDRELSDIFAVQDEIAAKVGEALKVALLSADSRPIRTSPETAIDVYSDYLLARQKLANPSFANLSEAASLLKGAIARDPNYAPAYAALAGAYWDMGAWGMFSFSEASTQMIPMVEQALSLDGDLAEAWQSLAYLRQANGDLQGARAAAKKALGIDPQNPLVLIGQIRHWQWTHEPERSLVYVDALLRVDPLSPVSLVTVARLFARLGQFDDAQRMLERIRSLNPQSLDYLWYASFLAAGRGDLVTALTLALEGEEIDADDPEAAAYLAIIYFDLGDIAAANFWNNAAHQIKPETPVAMLMAALLHLYRGEEAEAIAIARELVRPGSHNRNTRGVALRLLAASDMATGNGQEIIALYLRHYPELANNQLPTGHLIAINPLNWEGFVVTLDLAAVYLRAKHDDLAKQLLSVVESELPHWPAIGLWGSGLANVELHALRGNKEQALAALREIVAAGMRYMWRLQLLYNPNLESIRDTPEFAAIVAEIEADMAAQLERVREMERNGELEPIPEVSATTQ
jgi:TolB-like protein